MSKDFSHILKDVGLKTTPARSAILAVFSEQCGPVNALHIFKKVKNKDINQVTVYRALSSLEKLGVLNRVDLRKDSVYYELADTHHHHHIVCLSCGKTEEFELCDAGKILKEVLKKSSQFKAVKDHSFELFGICKACSKK